MYKLITDLLCPSSGFHGKSLNTREGFRNFSAKTNDKNLRFICQNLKLEFGSTLAKKSPVLTFLGYIYSETKKTLILGSNDKI